MATAICEHFVCLSQAASGLALALACLLLLLLLLRGWGGGGGGGRRCPVAVAALAQDGLGVLQVIEVAAEDVTCRGGQAGGVEGGSDECDCNEYTHMISAADGRWGVAKTTCACPEP